MKRLLMVLSLLVSSYLVAQEFNEETYAYENFEYNIAFDLTKDWIKDSEENESAELALNFLSPLKKQFTVSVREIDSELSLNEFFETTLAKQEEEGTFSTQDKVVETIMIGDKEMVHMSALLVFDFFSVKTHVYFHVADGFGYYWAMFSQKLDMEFQDELSAIVETVRPAAQSLPVMDEESQAASEEVVLDERKCGTCNCQDKPCETLIVDTEEELVIEDAVSEEVIVTTEEELVVENAVSEEVIVTTEEELVVENAVSEEVIVTTEEELVVEDAVSEEVIVTIEEELVINPEEVSQEDLEPAELLSLDSEVMVQVVVGDEPKPDDSDEVSMQLALSLEDDPSEDDESGAVTVSGSDEVETQLVVSHEDDPSEDDESDEAAC